MAAAPGVFREFVPDVSQIKGPNPYRTISDRLALAAQHVTIPTEPRLLLQSKWLDPT